MLIRPMTVRDKAEILKLDPQIFPHETPWDSKDFDFYFDEALCFVSYDESKKTINGYVFAKLNHESVLISNIGTITPACGVGSQLMQSTIKAIQDKHSDKKWISLQVRINNGPAIKLYQKYNFFMSHAKADKGFVAMTRPLNLGLTTVVETSKSDNFDTPREVLDTVNPPLSRKDVGIINLEIKRLRTNALSIFSIGNTAKADAIKAALDKTMKNGEDVRFNKEVREALAKHRICGFFGLKTANALLRIDESLVTSLGL